MARGRRRVEDPATARRILAAAEQHFAAQGLAGARTEEIAMAAHANKAMLYYYFGNKRRLHRAVFENLLRQLRAAVFSGFKRKAAPGETFFAGVSGYFDFLAAHPNYPRLVLRQAMEAGAGFGGGAVAVWCGLKLGCWRSRAAGGGGPFNGWRVIS